MYAKCLFSYPIHVKPIQSKNFMKRNFIRGAFVAAIALMATVYASQQEKTMSDLALANVEALANFEWDQNGWYCWRFSKDDYDSDLFFTYIRCFDCYVSTAISVWQQEQCWY